MSSTVGFIIQSGRFGTVADQTEFLANWKQAGKSKLPEWLVDAVQEHLKKLSPMGGGGAGPSSGSASTSGRPRVRYGQGQKNPHPEGSDEAWLWDVMNMRVFARDYDKFYRTRWGWWDKHKKLLIDAYKREYNAMTPLERDVWREVKRRNLFQVTMAERDLDLSDVPHVVHLIALSQWFNYISTAIDGKPPWQDSWPPNPLYAP